MKTQTLTRPSGTVSWATIVVAGAGAFHIAIGLLQLLAPAWFFEYIGDFAPFNRHYIGDLGAFTLPLGVGLWVAARDLRAYRAVVGVAALADLLHVLNHFYDDWVNATWSFEHLSTELIPLLAIAVLLLAVWWQAGQEG